MLLSLHSNLFPTNLKATTASIACNFGLALSDSRCSPTDRAGRAAQQLSIDNLCWIFIEHQYNKQFKNLYLVISFEFVILLDWFNLFIYPLSCV
jgi:hypothetical protein